MKKAIEPSAERPAKALFEQKWLPVRAKTRQARSGVLSDPMGAETARGRRSDSAPRRASCSIAKASGAKVGVDEVVERAGVTKPSLYRASPPGTISPRPICATTICDFWEKFGESRRQITHSDPREHVPRYIRVLSTRAVREVIAAAG